ncbi:4-hydroxybenzoate 3-monooxygenase [Kitasatospora viridis]|uniref:p-hydroxybenzoate 3-monooxygenase n=1 Tax=Kitasatospora viridis TaxID=281105 RepID=A0A561TT41_9ACTN|nr:4-hydroxybenzoate 3-monooxygenase [Kitasatospora viridis]TWF90285.1 p-hydroxybenzoate 3-monooxygenase [Kitasatospora viridis]
MERLRTQVAVIGAGPAGLVLANVLRQAGIDCLVLERHSREYVQARARAGLIEPGTVEFLARHGLAGQLVAEGAEHGACEFRHRGERFSVPYGELSGGRVHHVYPQQFLVRDLIDAYLDAGGTLLFEQGAEALTGLDGDRALVRAADVEIECEFVAGADGFHGISRAAVPERLRQGHGQHEFGQHEYGKQHEFGWLAVLAETPPATREIVYALHEDGFAGHMLRTPSVSRFYLQCPLGDDPANWPDERIWSALHRRLAMTGDELKPGPITEKAVLDMRSHVTEPMRHGRLFLLGDAAHIISPAGGKGMNLAIADAAELARRLLAHYAGREGELAGYSAARLPRIWQAQEFSHWLLHLLHSPDPDGPDAPFLHRLQLSRLAQLRDSPAHSTAFAVNYVGAPID